MKLPHVYIAGPYTRPDPIINTRRAVKAGMRLYKANLAYPVIPHLTMLTHLLDPQDVEFWYEFDLHALARCDAVLRLRGESTGADREVRFALEHGISVFDLEHDRDRDVGYLLTQWCNTWKARHG